jgi:hypothetical protein
MDLFGVRRDARDGVPFFLTGFRRLKITKLEIRKF